MRIPIVDIMYVVAMGILLFKQEWFGIAYLSIGYGVFNAFSKYKAYKKIKELNNKEHEN